MENISLRDYFAGQALNGLVAFNSQLPYNYLAKQAYKLADEMIEARYEPAKEAAVHIPE